MMGEYRGRYDRWRSETYPRIAPLLATFTLITAMVASVGVLWLTKVQGDEQDRRAYAINGLLECFDTYAAKSATTSKAVRDASVTLADATTTRDVALDHVFKYIATEAPRDTPEARRLFATLLTSNAALVESQKNLADVRDANPVPDAPSSFCEVQP